MIEIDPAARDAVLRALNVFAPGCTVRVERISSDAFRGTVVGPGGEVIINLGVHFVPTGGSLEIGPLNLAADARVTSD